jgi:hypothetical protein
MLAMNATISISSYAEHNRARFCDEIRRRALARLYERRQTVDELIGVLERYQEQGAGTPAPCIEFSAARKCS